MVAIHITKQIVQFSKEFHISVHTSKHTHPRETSLLDSEMFTVVWAGNVSSTVSGNIEPLKRRKHSLAQRLGP